MIKENKKNKIITFLCACLIVCASALGLISAVGTTLASSPTEPTITIDSFNYQQTNYLNNFDDYANYVSISVQSNYFYDFHLVNNSIPNFTANSFKYYFLTHNNTVTTISGSFSGISNVVSGANSLKTNLNSNSLIMVNWSVTNQPAILVIYNGSTYYTIANHILANQFFAWSSADMTGAYNNGYNIGYNEGYNEGYEEGELEGYENGYQEGVDFGYTQGVNAVLNNPNNYGLYTQAQYQQNYTDGYNAGVTQGQNNVINNPNDFGLNTNQQLQDSYNEGFADGEQSTDAYQNGYNTGYTDGSNEVLNNPNNYNLYTQAQYEQNYTDGYNKGLTYARYGIFADITPIVKYGHISANTVIENPFSYYLNGLVFSDNVISMFPPNDYESGIMTVEINFNNDFVYTNDDFLKFFLPQTRVANVEYNLIDINNNVYTYVSSVETTGSTSEDMVTIFTNGPKTVDGSYVTGPVPSGSIIKQLSFVLINPEYYGLTQFYFHQIDNGYDLGYTTGFDQGFKNGVTVGGNESYQTGYNNGSVDGFNSGYAQGLANQDNATFSSMISAVIDVPINAIRNLFNFELLGINLFGFFTALFTLLVVITIVRLILGGK